MLIREKIPPSRKKIWQVWVQHISTWEISGLYIHKQQRLANLNTEIVEWRNDGYTATGLIRSTAASLQPMSERDKL